MIQLPNNRLILNGHRIINKEQLFAYISKKFKTEIGDIKEFINILKDNNCAKIEIWHAGSFLENNKEFHEELLNALKKHREIKQTGIH